MTMLTGVRPVHNDAFEQLEPLDREHVWTNRFPNVDTFEGVATDPQSLHKYLYTHADPVNGVDPTGRQNLSVQLATIGVAVGLIALGAYIAYSEQGGEEHGVRRCFRTLRSRWNLRLLEIRHYRFGWSCTKLGQAGGTTASLRSHRSIVVSPRNRYFFKDGPDLYRFIQFQIF